MITLPNGEKCMSVGELRKAITELADDLPVSIFVEEFNRPGRDPYYYTVEAKYLDGGSISYDGLEIRVGKSYGL